MVAVRKMNGAGAAVASLLLAAALLASPAFVAVVDSARSAPVEMATQDDVKKPDCVPAFDPHTFPGGHGGTATPLPPTSHGGGGSGSTTPPPSHGSGSGSTTPPPSHGSGSGTSPSHGGGYGSSPAAPSHGGGGSPSHGGGGYGTSPTAPSTGGRYGGGSPSSPTTPSHGGGGAYGSSPTPSHGAYGGSSPTPTTPSYGGSPATPTPSHGGSPTTPSYGGSPATPTPSYGGSPTTPSHGTATPTPFIPVDPNSPGTCDYWRSHPMEIWSAIGRWPSSVGHFFGTAGSSAAGGADLSIQDALGNTRSDGAGALLREGSAALLNSITRVGFPYTTEQVRQAFAAAAGRSDSAAAAQAAAFKKANEGKA